MHFEMTVQTQGPVTESDADKVADLLGDSWDSMSVTDAMLNVDGAVPNLSHLASLEQQIRSAGYTVGTKIF